MSETFFPNWWILDWVFAEIGSTSTPHGITGPLNGIPNHFSWGISPSDKRSWMFRKLVKHSMESAHHFSSRPDCNNTADVPSFTLRTALSAIPFVCDLCGVDVTMISGKIFTSFAKFQGIVSVSDFRLPIRLQELLQAPFCVSWEVFVLHGYDWIHWEAKSCTTTAHRWLFRDSQPSLRTLWSAVIKSPTFSARGTAPPIRLLHGALVILVLWQISQFRSFGKWV